MTRLIRILAAASILAALTACSPPAVGTRTAASDLIYDPNFYFRPDHPWEMGADFLYRGMGHAPAAAPAQK